MYVWHLARRTLKIAERPLVMGIVNVTPDSFSDGGRYISTKKAIAHALALVEQGADILDIGGESTRPGATPVPLDEELRRVVPVIEGLAGKIDVPISIDTSKAEVARRCLAAGAEIVNDITALAGDPKMLEVVQSAGAGAVLMHMQGTPATMQADPHYDNVIDDLLKFFRQRLRACSQAGIRRNRLVIDPGIGFGKRSVHNLEILARLAEFQQLRRPLLLGVSRKRFIRAILDKPAGERLIGSLAVICYAAGQGAVQIVRVHDVQPTAQAMKLCGSIAEAGGKARGR